MRTAGREAEQAAAFLLILVLIGLAVVAAVFL